MNPFFETACVLLLVCCAALPADVAAQRILYVDVEASGANDGSAWADAFTDLQDALAAATPGDEIWVAEGVYKPVVPADASAVTDTERDATFHLKDGVRLYGGFVGNETGRDERDVLVYTTILSGDLLGNDNDTVDVDERTRAENSYHVVRGAEDLDATATLDGFTITAGNANTLPPRVDDTGGGLYLVGGQDATGQIIFSAPTLANLIVAANSARFGGGMGTIFGSPTVRNAVFIGNVADDDGGGMHNFVSTTTLRNVVFRDNTCRNFGGGLMNNRGASLMHGLTMINNTARRGGGMYNLTDPSVVISALFLSNVAEVSGGGMYNDESAVQVMNAVFAGNRTLDPDQRGGGAMGNFHERPFLTNIVFYGNTSARDGGAIFNVNSKPDIVNSILWANTADGIEDEICNCGIPGDSTRVFTSIVEGGLPAGSINGGANLDADPLFVDPDGPDDILGTQDDDFRLLAASPGIDAGLNQGLLFDVLDLDGDGDTNERVPVDLDGNARVHDGGRGVVVVDMGAYEFDAPGILVAVDDALPELPAAPIFLAAYPNPFQGQATLRYALPATGRAVMRVYDMLGREVATLVDGLLPAGAHEVRFDAPHLASGLYLYHLEAAGRTTTRTMLLVK